MRVTDCLEKDMAIADGSTRNLPARSDVYELSQLSTF
jgi:hypothetical protein